MKKKTIKELTKDDIKEIIVLDSVLTIDTEISDKLNIGIGAVRKVIKDNLNASKGLGDTVEKVLSSKPLKAITQAVKGFIFDNPEDCGCDERKESLNKTFRFNNIKWLNKVEYNWLTEYDSRADKSKLLDKDTTAIFTMWNRVFDRGLRADQKWCTCNPKVYVSSLRDLYKMHKEMKSIIETKKED